GGSPGARQGRRDLAPDEARLAHPGDDDAPAAAVEAAHGAHEAVAEPRAEGEHALPLEAQHPLRERPDPRAIHQARPGPAAIARISSSRRGRSSSPSMLGPSASGRPSSSVRSGSSWISMNRASTPTATAARARACTYCRSPPERSPCPPGSCTEWVASNTTGQPVARSTDSERMSATRLLYPKEKPRSHTRIAWFPVERALSTTFCISHGERNWPFLMLTGLPCEAVLRMKFVWRHRNAGVCSTSTTAATSASGVSSCTSVSTGTPITRRTSSRTFRPASSPRPRKLAREERLALS